ncbi:cell wall-binding repeat-containing protein [Clostridium kluyveri]|uniref:Cell wall-binding repeat 2 family protein n=1 Tax=Clostridium kluyveri TaxID=1534 RepID=A0A1L5FAH4_CLOKL|nr:cell wall-binding repeat-containing protein [Clostridium kluyveri]APM40021.1 cell wall-binding repeat 2 family protein [Clostridium kluyveri]UZQ49741.1 cell wall-binding repeat-containing protein [Clostridium kluyveri]
MNIRKIGCLLLAILCLNFGILNQAEAAITPERIGGFTRYDTSVLICKNGWQESSDYAVIVSGQDFQDTLCAVPLAKKYNAPILLTPKDKLDNPVQWINLNKELYRLKVKKIFLIGGESSISPDIEHEFIDRGIEITRIDGKDKYDTSFKIAEIVGVENGIVMVNEKNYSDSITMSSIAASKGMPLILVPKTVDSTFQKSIEDISKYVPKVYVVGDSNLISDDIISRFNNADRILGKDEYEISVNALEKFQNDVNYDTVYLANEDDLSDGLLGSAVAALTSSPIILIKDKYDSRIQDYLRNKLNLIRKINVLGGQGVISDSTLESILLISKNEIINDNIVNTSMNEGEVNSIGKGIEHSAYNQLDEPTKTIQEESKYIISLINNSKIDLSAKVSSQEEKALGNMQKDVTIQVAGMNIQTTGWLVIDNTGIREVVKIPDILRPYLPKEVQEKQYIIMDPLAIISNGDNSSSDFRDMANFENNFQPQFESFLKKYSEGWNSGFDFITYKGLMRMDTEEGPKYAKTYNLKLTDVTFKSILDYTQKNFMQDKDFISFVKQLLITCIDLSKDGNKDIQKKQLENTFALMYSHPETALSNMKNFMDAVKDVNIIGDNGVDITYNICDGYIVGENGTVDLNTSIGKLISIINSASEKGEKITADNIKSALDLGFNFSVESYNRNKSVEINLPEVTETNSIDYNEIVKINNNKKK